MRNLSAGSEVNYVAAPATEGGKTSIKKGKVMEVISQSAAGGAVRIDLAPGQKDKDGNPVHNQAIAEYSLGGEAGTFHFPDETKDVKQSDSFGEKPAPSTAAAAATAGVNNK